jgi:hypothetical protein
MIYIYYSCQKWVEFCENDQISNLFSSQNFRILSQRFICSDHFEEQKYNNPSKKIRLMSNAIPSIKNKSVSDTIISTSCELSLDSYENQIEVQSNNNSVEGQFFN